MTVTLDVVRESWVGTEPPSNEDTLAGSDAYTVSGDEPLRIGDEIGRYVVLEPVGRGAMGIVYKAFDPQLDRAIALKLLFSGNNPAAQSRLMQEARAIAKVTHPNVIAVHDVGTHNGRVFFAMELVDGSPLGAWRQESSPDLETILRVFRDAGAGLAAAHAAGLVHRDFKPDNVLIDRTGRVRVLDFGLAQADARDTSQTDPVVGTPAYMAPESFAGEPADAKSDQFSFCVALYEALSGERPFQGETLASLSSAIVAGERTHTDLSGVPPRIAAATERGLSHDRGDRFASMDDLLAQLEPRNKLPWGRMTLVGLAVLGGAYALGREGAKAPDPCENSKQPLLDTWTSNRREEIESSFAASGAPNADDMAARVRESLDSYAARWETAAAESCRMTVGENTLSPTLSFRSEYCIDTTLEAFGKQLQTLTDLDIEGVQRSLHQIDRLTDPQECIDADRLALRVEIPADPALRHQVLALAPEFAALASPTGPAADCLELAIALEDKTRAIGHGPTISRALTERSRCEFASGKAEQGYDTKQLAFEEALASAHDELAIGIAADIAHVHAIRRDDLDGAERWLRRAEALAWRHHLPDGRAKRALLNGRGVLAARRGDVEGSIRWFTELAERTLDVHGGAQPHLAAMQNIGVALARDDRNKEAVPWLERAVVFSEQQWGPGHRETAKAEGLLASVLMNLGQLVQARTHLLSALKVMTQLQANDLAYANSMHNLAEIELSLGHPDRALPYARSALQIRKDQQALDSAGGAELREALARLEQIAGNYDAAEPHARACLEYRENKDKPFETAEPLLVLAAIDLHRGEQESARILFQRARALVSTDQEGTGRAPRAVVVYRLAAELLEAGDEAQAMELFARAEAFAEQDDQREQSNALRLRYAEALDRQGQRTETHEILQRVETVLELHPYPPSVVEGARALRERVGPS